jgi:ankyrin repeat protein
LIDRFYHLTDSGIFLSLAVTKNQFKAARLLLKSGANSNAPGPEGQTPLVDAVLNNNTKVHSFIF